MTFKIYKKSDHLTSRLGENEISVSKTTFSIGKK